MASPDTVVEVKEKAPLMEKKKTRPHLPALDTLRFFLISYIVVGHFIQVATANELLLRLFSQINVVVGAFFVISGYMAGYTATEVGKLEASPRLQPASTYIINRVMGYYHLHALVTILFLPMFAYADYTYNGTVPTVANGALSLFLCQAWFPLHAEVWNAPMWFLSAMSFATLPMPAAVSAVARLSKRGLWQTLTIISLTLLIARLAYSYDLDCWTVMEGRLTARTHPNILAWNVLRFNPTYAFLEILMGVVTVRFVMLDGLEAGPAPSVWSPLPSLGGMVAIIVARAYGVLALNDPLTRSLLFLPLFLMFLVNLHRQTIYGTGSWRLSELMSLGPLTYLGGISFPIFVVHGPVGQLFYKKVIAKKIFSSVWQDLEITDWPSWFFFVYLGTVLVAAVLLQHGFLNQKKVREANGAVSRWLISLFN